MAIYGGPVDSVMATSSAIAAVPQPLDRQAQDVLLASGIPRKKQRMKKCLGPVHLGTPKRFGMNANGTSIDPPKELAKRECNDGHLAYIDCDGTSSERTLSSNTCEATKNITDLALQSLAASMRTESKVSDAEYRHHTSH